MELKELRENSRKMLATFINAIGLDGEWYSKINETPLIWGTPLLDAPGQFIAPGSKGLENFLKSTKCNDSINKILNQKGLILINPLYKKRDSDFDLYVTLIHETLHANRDLLLYDNFREGENPFAYSYNNSRFEQNTKNFSSKHADASQEVFKGSIDFSQLTINSYKAKTSEELEDMKWPESKVDDQMEKQQIVDEALVELMAILSYNLYSSKQEGKEQDIWNTIEQARDNYKGKDISVMCDIILKHHDFELFNWMIDPIEYSNGDIHYNFFEKYTKNDEDLLIKLYDTARKNSGLEFLLDIPKDNNDKQTFSEGMEL